MFSLLSFLIPSSVSISSESFQNFFAPFNILLYSLIRLIIGRSITLFLNLIKDFFLFFNLTHHYIIFKVRLEISLSSILTFKKLCRIK